ncbi:MAG: hypothetical protein AAEJ65_04325, partial [Planctomycetota bacterium]
SLYLGARVLLRSRQGNGHRAGSIARWSARERPRGSPGVGDGRIGKDHGLPPRTRTALFQHLHGSISLLAFLRIASLLIMLLLIMLVLVLP